jgi:hypothetical protein
MEDIDNAGKFDNVKEDEGNINDHKTHKMPTGNIINQGHLLQEVLLIHAQEDTYMILLLGCKKYIDIISNVPIGWVLRVSSSLELCSSL